MLPLFLQLQMLRKTADDFKELKKNPTAATGYLWMLHTGPLKRVLRRVFTFKDVNTLGVWGVLVWVIGGSEEASFWFLHPRSTLTGGLHPWVVFHWNTRGRRETTYLRRGCLMKGDVAASSSSGRRRRGDYRLYPSLLPQTTRVREDLQQLEEQKRQTHFWWKTVTSAGVSTPPPPHPHFLRQVEMKRIFFVPCIFQSSVLLRGLKVE